MILVRLYPPNAMNLLKMFFFLGDGWVFVLHPIAENKMEASIAYIVESLFFQHARLSNVNIAPVKRLEQLSLIHAFSNCDFNKCLNMCKRLNSLKKL